MIPTIIYLYVYNVQAYIHNRKDDPALKQWKIRILAVLVLLVGVGLMGYPVLSNLVFEKRQQELADYYESMVVEIAPEERNSHWDECDAYNRFLASEATLSGDPFANDLDPETLPYRDLLNINGDNIMGIIQIPGITGNLAIYHGTKEDVLQKGVGHLQGTSLPVGGSNTHCVLSAHCGLPNKKLFTNLDQVETGDVFYLYIMGETLSYQVDQILVVLPHETEEIQIKQNGDYVTLVTCTPYGINSHRLLVRGTRIPNEEAEQVASTQTRRASTWRQQYIKSILTGLGIAAALALVIWLIRLFRNKKQSKNDSNSDPA